jgi:hypothetical protein
MTIHKAHLPDGPGRRRANRRNAPLGRDRDRRPEARCWRHALSIELKCLTMAVACEGNEMDQAEPQSVELTELELVEMLQLLARRAEAGAELASRSRVSPVAKKKINQLLAASGGRARGPGRQLAAWDRTGGVLGRQLAASGRLVESDSGQLAASGRLNGSLSGQLAASGRLGTFSGGSWLGWAGAGGFRPGG